MIMLYWLLLWKDGWDLELVEKAQIDSRTEKWEGIKVRKEVILQKRQKKKGCEISKIRNGIE